MSCPESVRLFLSFALDFPEVEFRLSVVFSLSPAPWHPHPHPEKTQDRKLANPWEKSKPKARKSWLPIVRSHVISMAVTTAESTDPVQVSTKFGTFLGDYAGAGPEMLAKMKNPSSWFYLPAYSSSAHWMVIMMVDL